MIDLLFVTPIDATCSYQVLICSGCRCCLVHHTFPYCAGQSLTAIARYVPNPSPAVFRTTKNNHNILQGVADPDLRLTTEAKAAFDAWILKNGLRWTAEGGPLAPGGVDIAFIGGLLYGILSNRSNPRFR